MARRRRGLTPEERDLWSRVARTANPRLPAGSTSGADDEDRFGPRPDSGAGGPMPQALRTTPPKPLSLTPPIAAPMPVPPLRIGQNAPAGRSSFQPGTSPAERLAQSPLRMDAKLHRRLNQGKLRPEARLDLHGMTLAAAHPALTGFVLSCHGQGLRLVLVITGKGKGDHGPLPTRPGALRHQVPHWLHSPPLGAVVQQVTAAHFRHGGEGAYYVYLRRQ